MNIWKEKFNNLPKEIRIIGSAMESITRIQHCREINDHIKNLEV